MSEKKLTGQKKKSETKIIAEKKNNWKLKRNEGKKNTGWIIWYKFHE